VGGGGGRGTRRLDARRWLLAVAPFVLAALVVNLYPFRLGSATELLDFLTAARRVGAAAVAPHVLRHRNNLADHRR
jgi:hypothetical protein